MYTYLGLDENFLKYLQERIKKDDLTNKERKYKYSKVLTLL